METVGRFAPSPSGRLHLGNLLCALLVWLSARQKDGRVLLRVEDLDTARCPRRYSEQMERDLQWLGLDWDIGPGRDNGTGPYYQSQRTEIYQAALETLREKGLVYPCFCTRAELHAASAPHREDGQVVYAGTCRRLTAAEIAEKSRNRAPALRLITPEERWVFTDGQQDASDSEATWADTRKIWRQTAAIFCCGGPMGCSPTSWLWWWMTPPWA